MVRWIVTKQRQTTTSGAQAPTTSRTNWPGKRTAVTPGRSASAASVAPGKRSRVQSVRRVKPKSG
jgi:hypothetical protein